MPNKEKFLQKQQKALKEPKSITAKLLQEQQTVLRRGLLLPEKEPMKAMEKTSNLRRRQRVLKDLEMKEKKEKERKDEAMRMARALRGNGFVGRPERRKRPRGRAVGRR